MVIDYKWGKITWDNSDGWVHDDEYYRYNQDILQIDYGENCVIDVGNYYNDDGGGGFVIFVINYSHSETDDEKAMAWTNRYATIPCKDKADMLQQLQRAIDIYPSMINR